jgi:hypothetical protein
MRITKPRSGLLLVTAALLATGVSSMAVAAQNQTSEPACYSTCAANDARLTEEWTLISYGNEQLQVFHVTVGAGVEGLSQEPTGTVAIKSGSTTLCTMVLSAGRGSCSPSPKALPAGFFGVRGYYSGDATFGASESNDETFEVSSVGSGD